VKTVEPHQLSIRDRIDCASAQLWARDFALAIGFQAPAGEEIALVAAELSSNLVRHAGHGIMTLRALSDDGKVGLELEANDDGPGIDNVDQAFADGFSTKGGLGYGLGCVNRLMDEVELSSTPGCGTRVVGRRWLRSESASSLPHLWEVGAATRSRRNADANGDAYVIHERDGKLLVGLIDGLGHGEAAQNAALAAQRYVQTHYDQPLDRIFAGAGRACSATRGVVMALARFESATKLRFATFGNVEARALSPVSKLRFAVQRGVLCRSDPKVEVQEIPWPDGGLLVLHTDGLRQHWNWHDFVGIERDEPHRAARRLIHELADGDDDATVVVVRSRAG
jgi:anti-sigma regulatory factor (Ser/Thr protein kinase)/serine/threonine protein phosphatase PrpC